MSQSYFHCSGSKFCLTRRCSLLLVAAVIILLFLSLTGILFLGLICDQNHFFWCRSCSTQTSCSEYSPPHWKGRNFLWAGLHTGLCPRQEGQGKQGKVCWSMTLDTPQKRTKKGPELKSPQSLGTECDRTVQLQRIG